MLFGFVRMGISAQRGVERPPGLSYHPAVPKRRFFHPKASSPLVLQPRGCRYPDPCDLQRFILRVILPAPAASALPIELPRGASDANGFPKGPFSKSRAQLKPGLAAQGPAGNGGTREQGKPVSRGGSTGAPCLGTSQSMGPWIAVPAL